MKQDPGLYLKDLVHFRDFMPHCKAGPRTLGLNTLTLCIQYVAVGGLIAQRTQVQQILDLKVLVPLPYTV